MSESILSTLREEHRRAKSLMEQIESCKDVVKKKELYLQLKEELIPHMEGEEQTIYAHLMEDVHDEEAEEVAQIAESEHQEVKDLLKQLDNMGIENVTWDTTFKKLKDCVTKHVEEEESALFAEAKQDFSKEELIEIGDEFAEAKSHITSY
ncbi:MAG: hemerythrin domain-containing protein [Bdellovibrionales bacterium]|nr:hemerythrin domain-containing protein [Bdellovibrionales bacterium]